MIDLIELLESLNRKERYFLIKQAVGGFKLSDEFRRELGNATGLAIPQDAFAAMDYHLDWLTAALHAYERGDVDRPFDNSQYVVRGNQEDIDLLVAFTKGGEHHIVLVEAKGATGWTNRQMRSKAERFNQIFGRDGNRYPRVRPHLCLISPRRPKQLRADEWPRWMSNEDRSYIWLELDFPKGRRKVTRCDAKGTPSVNGDHFRIVRADTSHKRPGKVTMRADAVLSRRA